MGDRVDLWGGLPDRPKPYFSAQRREATGVDGPWNLGSLSSSDRLMPTRRRGRGSVLMGVCAMTVFAGCLLFVIGDGRHRAGSIGFWAEHLSKSPFSVEAMPRFLHDSDGASRTLFAVSGTFGTGAAHAFAVEIDAARAEPGDVVALSSAGGDPAEAMAVGEIVRSRGLYTVVAEADDRQLLPSACSGACLLAFAGGAHRIALDRSALGVRQSVSRDLVLSDEPILAAQREMGLIVSYLSRMGVDGGVAAVGAGSRDVVWIDSEAATRWKLVDLRIHSFPNGRP